MNKLLLKPLPYQRKKLYALLLAGLVYLLFILILFVDIQRHTSARENQQKKSRAEPMHAQQDKSPAPVRFAQIPSKSSPAAPAQQAQPVQQQPQPTVKPPDQVITPPKTQEAPTKKELPTIDLRKVLPEQNKTAPDNKPETTKPELKKRSRDKWFKPSSIPATQEAPEQHQAQQQINQQQFASNLTAGFNNFVTQKKKIESQYSVNRVHGNQAESLEYEMFAGKLVHSVCAASHNDPLNPRSPLVKEHEVVLKVTCNRQRQVEDVSFIAPSYDEQINSYLVQLIKTISPPQFPSTHTADKMTFPMKIHMSRQYYGRGLRMSPA
jgi:hypothetical protein